MIKIPVRLLPRERAYPILVTSLDDLGAQLKKNRIKNKEAMVFTSPRIGGFYFDQVKRSLQNADFSRIEKHEIPDGEINKNSAEYNLCLTALVKKFPNPGSTPLVVNLGGGVIGDLCGFVAATYRRGLPYIQVPTTLLGFVDCGVGGKVGINFKVGSLEIKNLVGTYYQPKLVLADIQVLKTLDKRELRSGLAEVIKYGVVCDRVLFKFLENKFNVGSILALEPKALMHVFARCYKIKAGLVVKDEKDSKGIRIVLNFGHTIGHALETASGHTLTHGEAISVGMMGAIRLAVHLKDCRVDILERVQAVLIQAGLPVDAKDQRISLKKVMEIIRYDKKSEHHALRFVFPRTMGRHVVREIKDLNLVQTIIKDLI